MNCFNHPNEPAVARCVDCGKGLCAECASIYRPILCKSCYRRRKRNEIRRSILNLAFLIVLFAVGYKLNFLSTRENPDRQLLTGYLLMAVWAGYMFVEDVMPYKMMAGTNGQWTAYYIFKLALFTIVGFFIAPFTLLWAVFRIIKAFWR